MQSQVEMQHIPVKVYRSDERVTIAAPMPGLEPEDITVDLSQDGQLVLHGELRGTLKGDKEVIADEWNPGPYHREITISEPVDGEQANVTYGNGVIVVVLPRSGEMRAAQLYLDKVGPAKGASVGHSGAPSGESGEERHYGAV